MLVLGHRGASADAPENTLPAFLEAARQGADGVELDVMVCGSGEVVVCHDESLERLSGTAWKVAHTPYDALRDVDVGSSLGFGPATIPLLEDVFEALPKHFLLNIELKCDELDDRGLSEKVCDFVEARGLGERVLLSSFNPLCLIRAAKHAPGLRRGFLIDPERNFTLQNAVALPLTANHSVHPHDSHCTPERLEQWHERGLKIAVWTVDDPERAVALARAGASYCITNRPAALREAIRRGRG